MKIVDVTEFYSQRGGGVRSHLTLKSHVLCQWGHDHVVVAPGPFDEETSALVDEKGESSRRTSRGARNGPGAHAQGTARVIRVGGPSLPYDPTYHLLWRVDKVRAIVRRLRPDVLEINSPYVAAASSLSLKQGRDFGVRTFLWHADFIDTYLRVMLEQRAPSRLADVALEPLWAMVRTIGRGCDATIAGAQWQVDKLRAHGVPRVVRVPFGVDKAVFAPREHDAGVRRELLEGTPEGARLIVAIGRFAWEKRWDVLIDAFARIASRIPSRLVCFGDGPERAAIEARATRLGIDARFLGFITDRERLAATLSSADLLLHGCPFETFGLGVAEAVAAGCAIVVPDEGGAAELAFGASSITYRARNAEACAEAALELLARDALLVREAALTAREQIWSVEDQFSRTIELYDELLAERARP